MPEQLTDDELDFLDELVARSTALDPKFPQLLEAAQRRRQLRRSAVLQEEHEPPGA